MGWGWYLAILYTLCAPRYPSPGTRLALAPVTIQPFLCCFGALSLTSRITPIAVLRGREQSTDELPNPSHSGWTEPMDLQFPLQRDERRDEIFGYRLMC